jgi:hypothetical protein
MRTIHRSVCLVIAMTASPGVAAAQAPDWVNDLANEIAATMGRHADAFARTIEQSVEARAQRQGRGQPRGPEFTESFTRTVRLGRNGSFELENVAGAIVVTGAGGDDVRVEATKRVRRPNEAEAKTVLSEMTIEVAERSGRVEVRTRYPYQRNRGFGSVDYTVSVPRDASVTLRSVSGSIEVTNINGDLRAESVSGDLVAKGARRIRQAKTVSGNLEIADGEAEDLSVGSISGNIIVTKLKARDIGAQTVSGSVRLSDIESERAAVRSVSGDIEYAGRFARNGRYQLQSHSGDVRIAPSDDRGFAVDATTFSGDVRSDYPLTLQSVPDNAMAPGRRSRSIRGTFGDAGATLTLQSFSGDIVIAK